MVKFLIMTDQDLDGAHIKGLCINMFQSQWKELVKIPNFIGFMNTPILKARKGKKEKSFTIKQNIIIGNKLTMMVKVGQSKYYKGLGKHFHKQRV